MRIRISGTLIDYEKFLELSRELYDPEKKPIRLKIGEYVDDVFLSFIKIVETHDRNGFVMDIEVENQ